MRAKLSSRQRGVILMLVLILVATLFIMAAGFLATRTREREIVNASRDVFQAHQLAYAGLESARVKLLNDFDFPPLREATQEVFKYSETVMDYDGVNEVGKYQVFCDRRWSDPPYSILRVTAVGQVGDADGNPVRHKMIGEYDMRPGFKGVMVNLIDMGAF